jgi:hypothetical protein
VAQAIEMSGSAEESLIWFLLRWAWFSLLGAWILLRWIWLLLP